MKLPNTAEYMRVKQLLKDKQLNTVCEEASCPNIGECYSQGTATFMILGEFVLVAALFVMLQVECLLSQM